MLPQVWLSRRRRLCPGVPLWRGGSCCLGFTSSEAANCSGLSSWSSCESAAGGLGGWARRRGSPCAAVGAPAATNNPLELDRPRLYLSRRRTYAKASRRALPAGGKLRLILRLSSSQLPPTLLPTRPLQGRDFLVEQVWFTETTPEGLHLHERSQKQNKTKKKKQKTNLVSQGLQLNRAIKAFLLMTLIWAFVQKNFFFFFENVIRFVCCWLPGVSFQTVLYSPELSKQLLGSNLLSTKPRAMMLQTASFDQSSITKTFMQYYTEDTHLVKLLKDSSCWKLRTDKNSFMMLIRLCFAKPTYLHQAGHVSLFNMTPLESAALLKDSALDSFNQSCVTSGRRRLSPGGMEITRIRCAPLRSKTYFPLLTWEKPGAKKMLQLSAGDLYRHKTSVFCI